MEKQTIEAVKSVLIPYGGTAIDAAVLKRTDDLLLGGTIWLLPYEGASMNVVDSLGELGILHGRMLMGRYQAVTTFTTSKIGLVLHLSKDEVLDDLEEIDGYRFFRLEKLEDTLREERYLLNTPKWKIAQVMRATNRYKAEEEKKALQHLKEKAEKLSALIRSAGVPETEISMGLAKEILSFDVYYEYSDDHAFCIQYRAYERELRARLSKEGMLGVFDKHLREKA